MRILLIHQYFIEKDDGGGARFNEMSRIWGELGHQVTVIAGNVHGATGKKRPEYKGKLSVTKKDFYPNVNVIWTYVSEAYNVNFLGRLWAYFSFVFSCIYVGLFRTKGKYDVIICTSPPLFVGICAMVISFFRRTPYVFEVRDLWPESAIDTGVVTNKIVINLAYWLEKTIYKRAKLINVLTPAFRKKLIENKGISSDKIIMIPNAADFSMADELHKTFDRDKLRKEMDVEDKTVITYIGTHGVANHLIQVIDTAEIIKDELPDVMFLLVGDGMQKPMLIEETKKRNLKNIMFVDYIPRREVFKYIIASDFGASVLKKVDTFKTVYSNKTFDYMACKRPIFMLIDGVSRELVNNADCGIYSEPENPNAFADAIREYLKQNKGEIKTKGIQGYNYAKAHFDRDVLATNYVLFIEQKLKNE